MMDHSLKFTKSIAIQAGKENVWEALTNPAIIKLYFFGTETITDWEVGSPIIFQGEYEKQSYKDHGIIKKYEPEKALEYTYISSFSGLEDRPENYSLVSFQLVETQETTVLTLTQQGFVSEESMSHSEKNWEGVLQHMKELVEKP